ncbi:hypothetical protein BDFB_006103 [Asbolus verrucosus]|uniref:Uncharacterized protein n=1 Tax=Asbolus verrucosus TaxID=1661398 RepID=A0A482VMG0_ASBVE|nr:hypothetical protein BDFB_006103 [Asbolus verrucosus]
MIPIQQLIKAMMTKCTIQHKTKNSLYLKN